MKLYSTNNSNNIVNLKEAVLNSFPKDKGLYMPLDIPLLAQDFLENLKTYTFEEIGFMVAQNLIGDEIPEAKLYSIINKSLDFPAPLVKLNESLFTLELFHGPTMAFKDFGAKFMAELMSHFLRNEDRETTILVATSGDTGGAVASGFHNVPGINVVILYPSGKVSELQEKQLTTWGNNITAVEIDGVFDDCQALVKEAFIDTDLLEKFQFSSANSINIARLIPQSFYYFEGYKQLSPSSKETVFCVPSGNLGNLTAGLLAKKQGLSIQKFIAATNANDIVPQYLKTQNFNPKPSIETYSNAMDVGNPSNFPRMLALYDSTRSTWNNIKNHLIGNAFTDHETITAIQELSNNYQYIADPHGAVGYLASKAYLDSSPASRIVFLETAHPGKFDKVMDLSKVHFIMPEKLLQFSNKTKHSHKSSKDYKAFKALLLSL